MKIAVFHELPHGGARRAINTFSYLLKKRNVVHVYLTDEKKEKSEMHIAHKLFIHPFNTKQWKGKNWKTRLYKDTIEIIKLYLLHKKIARIIDRNHYDVIFVSASKYIEAPFILRFLKTPFVFYCSDPSYRIVYEKLFAVSKKLDFFRYHYEETNRFIRRILDRQNVTAAMICFAPSKFIAKKFTKIYKKANNALYYGVDSTFFAPSKRKKDIDIFYMGSYEKMDGLDLLEDSLKLMKVKPVVRRLLSEEEWIADDRELRELYRRSKIMFCPARNEGLGAGPMEAMSCGVPVVAVDEAGHKETIIDGRTGYLVPRDPKIIAKKLDMLLTDDKLRITLGQQARKEMATNWSWEKRTKDLEDIFLKLVQENNR